MTLDPHQAQAAYALSEAIKQNGAAYLAHDVGAGKTLTALAITQLLGVQRILVVTGPLAAVGVWKRELATWWPDEHVGLSYPLERGYGARGWNLPGHAWFDILNIDRLDDKQMALLLQHEPELLIFDEAHYAKTPSAQRTRRMWKVRSKIPWYLAMSGTQAHDIRDYWAQYRMIDPRHPLWAQPFGSYKKQVAKWKGPHGEWFDGELPGARAVVAEAVAPWTHYFEVKDMHLPEPRYQVVPVQLYEEERKAYAQMDHTYQAEIARLDGDAHTVASTALVKALRLHQLCCGHATDTAGVDVFAGRAAKFDALAELLTERRLRKTIVVCRFLSEVEHVHQWAVSHLEGVSISKINGSTPAKDRTFIVEQFQADDHPYLLIIQPRSGGIAETLTRADSLIFYSFEPSGIVFKQTVGRVYRRGQTTHVQILGLCAERTVEPRLWEGLRQHLEGSSLADYVRGYFREPASTEGAMAQSEPM